MPVAERPREKLLAKGAEALSDAELLAIFLRTGTRGVTAVDLARQLLDNFGGLKPLLQASEKDFCQHHGLGPAKYVQLQAVLEMAKRHMYEQLSRGDALCSPAQTRQFLSAQLSGYPHEVFACLFLDNRNRVIAFEKTVLWHHWRGPAFIRVRSCAWRSRKTAAATIFAHNHPSGVAEPSHADEQITQRLKEALALVDIRVLDHFVIGDEVVSFAERGLL